MNVLQPELLNLVSQGKKRNTELKQSAEKSLGLLEALPDSSDLSSLDAQPQFVTPFLVACTSSNSKSCASALQCIQIIVSSHAFAPERLNDLLDALLEAAQLGIAMQLKVLQLMPVLLQVYHEDIRGELLAKMLNVCTELNRDQKQMVSNTAYATLQQLITSLFDRLDDAPGDNTLYVATKEFKLNNNVYDAARILLDLCEIAERLHPRYLQFNDLPTPFTLELLELTLTNHSSVFHKLSVFRCILSSHIVPLLLRLFSESSNEFALVIRVARIFFLVIRKHLEVITVEAEVILNTLAQTCRNSEDLWIQVFCLEVFQGVFSDSTLLLQIFTRYREVDTNDTLRDIVDSFSAALVKSNIPMAVEANGGVIKKSNNPKVPCIDMLDKTEPPEFSSSYFFYLIMVCVNSLSDGLTKLSSASRKSPEDTEKIVGILQEVHIPLTNCFTILLSGAMDIDLFKLLVKSVQRIAHVCGVTNLASMRDEYITILAQYSYLPDDPVARAKLLQRNIFCVRALFNLGFALGNKLGKSWSLIIECIGSLATQIDPQYVATSESFFAGGDEFHTMSMSLRRMIDQTSDLEDESLAQIIDTLLGGNSAYIYLACAEYLVKVNAERFSNMKLWESFSSRALGLIKHTPDTDQKLAVGKMLDNSVVNVMEYVTDGEDLRAVVRSLYAQVQILNIDIQCNAITTMNILLDQFFAKFTSGWEQIFAIISWVAAYDGRPDLYKNTFKSLELICHDFLENLPYPCIFDLTLCLDQFSRQHLDLNTSFTATSLFWSVCDYLIKTQSEITVTEFDVNNEESLIAVAKDESSPLKQYALWMLAELKLAHIANEPQHQVKTGAAQIFFRLFNAHAKHLPDKVWEKCLELVFPEITKVQIDEWPSDADETYSIIINGLGSIYAANVARSVKGLVAVFSYFAACSRESVSNVVATLQQVISIMDAATDVKVHDERLNAEIWSYWVNQSANPEYNHRMHKMIYDSLEFIVELFPRIDQFMTLSTEQVSEAAYLITKCAEYNQNTTKLSSLQSRTLEQFRYIWKHHSDIETQSVVIRQVGELAVHCYSGVPLDNFLALSIEAQDLLFELLSQAKKQDDSSALKNSVILMQNSKDRSKAISIFLHILENTKERSRVERYIVEGGTSIISGGMEGDSQIKAIEKFIGLIENDESISLSAWSEIISSLTLNSLLYQRGYYLNTKYLASDEPVPHEIYGSIELEVTGKRNDVGYYCLDILTRLSLNKKPYSENARAQHSKRTEIVMLQDVGDSKLRGAEPMSSLLNQELLHILNQYKSNKNMVTPRVKQLLLKCIITRDTQVLSIIKDILL